MLWHHDYQRRLNAAETVRQEKLYRQSCLEAADTMTGHQFEEATPPLPTGPAAEAP